MAVSRAEFDRRMADALTGGVAGWIRAEREAQERLAREIMAERGLTPRPPRPEKTWQQIAEEEAYARWDGSDGQLDA